jgi:hypothetical protein
MRRAFALVSVCLLAGAASSGEDAHPADDAVAASNGVVVHNVDSKLLAARLRDVDKKTLAGDVKSAAADLAEILTGDVSPLVEEGVDAYLGAREACLQRIAALAPEGLAAYRATVDARAASVLAESLARGDVAALSRHANAMALSTNGPKMLVALADLRVARGDVRLAVQALTDLLRLWPESGATAEMPGVDRAAVVLRLASLLASLGDESGVWWLARETSPKLLASPSPATAGAKLEADLARCAAAALRRGAPPAFPAGELRVAAQFEFAPERARRLDSTTSREVDEHPLPIGTPERPVLLTRETAETHAQARVVALAPDAAGTGALVPLWTFPSDEENKAVLRRGGRGPFAPARSGDLLIFPWPVEPSAPAAPGQKAANPDDEQNTLPMLSISGEGRLVDERGGDDEKRREDGDLELAATLNQSGEIVRPALSFCGRPLVVGDSVFTTLVRRTENGGATELHVARFDIVAEGATRRLRERWRRHVLDGDTMPPARYPSENSGDYSEALAAPASLAERFGRVYVASNTGAVACVDASDGRVAWVQAYERFGPSSRGAVLAAKPKTWNDLPVLVDGPFVWTAPRDSDYVLQFRAMPRSARTTLVQSWRFRGGPGTSAESGPLLPNLSPDKLVAVAHGVGWFAGATYVAPVSSTLVGTPLASFRLRDARPDEPRRTYAEAQIPEAAAFGSPCVVDGAILFPTSKAIYRVALDAFESTPATVARPTPPSSPRSALPDQIGNLVPDGDRLWSVTPYRAVLLTRANSGQK